MEQSKSILSFILETATRRLFSTFSCALYLFFMYVRAEKVFSHKYASLVNQSGSVRWSASWDQVLNQKYAHLVPQLIQAARHILRKSKSDIEWTCIFIAMSRICLSSGSSVLLARYSL